ncbi:MAG: hypothetical protein PHU85_16130 [Phycisphaerae bacterium]|nr:hypothetical protein [Phycisphaerae bacterium]
MLTLAMPLIDPIYIGAHWYLMLAPLAIGIAVIYKTLKVRHVRQVPLEALWLTVTILVGMAAAAAGLFLIYHAFSAAAR